MIKDNQKYFNALQRVLDALMIAGSYMLSWYLKFKSPFANIDPGTGTLSMESYFFAMVFIVPGYMILYSLCNLYTSKRVSRVKSEFYNIVKANTVGLILFLGVLYIIRQHDFSRAMIFIFYGLNVVLSTLSRAVVRQILREFRKKGYNLKHILLVGYSRSAEAYVDRIIANPQWGYHICGILDDRVPRGTTYKGVKVLGDIDNLDIILPENKLDEIAVTLALEDYDRLEEIVGRCEKAGVHTKFIPDYNRVIPSRPYTEDLQGLPVINIRYVPLTNTVNWVMKRLVDIFGSIVAIILSSPFMLLSVILIKATSPGRLFLNRNGSDFTINPSRCTRFQASWRCRNPARRQ